MKYGQIAGNKSINEAIYRCFEYICEEDARKFVRKFLEQHQDEDGVMHTLRELILGAFLGLNGFNVKYERAMGRRTPDWCILDKTLEPMCIVEVTNFHIDRATENDINAQFQAGGVWLGRPSSNVKRLYDRIRHKASSYKVLAHEYGVAYIIALFGELKANVDLEELQECLLDERDGLFGNYPVLSGLLFFEDTNGPYQFTYIPNRNPMRRIDLPCGFF